MCFFFISVPSGFDTYQQILDTIRKVKNPEIGYIYEILTKSGLSYHDIIALAAFSYLNNIDNYRMLRAVEYRDAWFSLEQARQFIECYELFTKCNVNRRLYRSFNIQLDCITDLNGCSQPADVIISLSDNASAGLE